MPRRFHSSKKGAKKKTLKPKGQVKFSLKEFSQETEQLPVKKKMVMAFGFFVSCLFLGVVLAIILNTPTVSFLAKFGKLPFLSSRSR